MRPVRRASVHGDGRVERATLVDGWTYTVTPWARKPSDLPVTTGDICGTCSVAIQLGGYCRCSD